MKLGMVGLGRMGLGMTKRLRAKGHEVVGFDRNPELTDAASVSEMLAQLPSPKVIWLMVPSGQITEDTMQEVAKLLSAGDILIDGGNSNHKDSVRRGTFAAELGVHYLDVGTSGGIWGLENGFCLMAGGDEGSL